MLAKTYNVKTKRGAVKRANAIIRQCYIDGKGGMQYGLDLPTFSAVWPERYSEYLKLKRIYKTLPD